MITRYKKHLLKIVRRIPCLADVQVGSVSPVVDESNTLPKFGASCDKICLAYQLLLGFFRTTNNFINPQSLLIICLKPFLVASWSF